LRFIGAHVKLGAPAAISVAGVDAQTRVEVAKTETASGATDTDVVPVVMPQPFWPCTVYTFVAVGMKPTPLVTLFDHVYVIAPVAVRVRVRPRQMLLVLLVMLRTGAAVLEITFVVVCEMQPSELVPLRVYVVVVEGLTVMLLPTTVVEAVLHV
jgi:hypothetical protein